jgi:hypothetical protein
VLDPASLFTLTDTLPELDHPVLVHALPGFVDAGSGVRLATEHLLETLPSSVVARFDHDVLIDYRGARPALVFAEDHYQDYVAPEIVLHAVEDADGTRFLLLAGREPDFQWERFGAAVIDLVRRLDARVSIGLLAIPMTIPHTRPMSVTGHGSKPGLVPTDGNIFSGEIRVPASVSAFLELRLGEAGLDAGGFAAHVPHYLAATEYPDAAITLIERLSAATGLNLPTDQLTVAAATTRESIEEQVAASTEVQEVVAQLERQHDAVIDRDPGTLLDADGELPSGDQIGAEFERFLAGLDDGGKS